MLDALQPVARTVAVAENCNQGGHLVRHRYEQLRELT